MGSFQAFSVSANPRVKFCNKVHTTVEVFWRLSSYFMRAIREKMGRTRLNEGQVLSFRTKSQTIDKKAFPFCWAILI